jgi:hypothetical protein
MKTPVFKLPQPQPPKPSAADLEQLTQLVERARKAPAHHWKATQRIGLLRAACDFLEQGKWEQAEDATEKALKREKDGLTGSYAARFSELLIKLKDKATCHQNGEALKVSLRKELAHVTAKAPREVPAPRVLRAAMEQPPREAAPLSRTLDAAPAADHGTVAPVERASTGRGPVEEHSEPVPQVDSPQRRGPAVVCGAGDHRAEEILVARVKLALLKDYWGAIASRVGTEIMRCALACKQAGLVEVYKETTWQLANKDLHQAHRRARQIAVEAWRGLL